MTKVGARLGGVVVVVTRSTSNPRWSWWRQWSRWRRISSEILTYKSENSLKTNAENTTSHLRFLNVTKFAILRISEDQ